MHPVISLFFLNFGYVGVLISYPDEVQGRTLTTNALFVYLQLIKRVWWLIVLFLLNKIRKVKKHVFFCILRDIYQISYQGCFGGVFTPETLEVFWGCLHTKDTLQNSYGLLRRDQGTISRDDVDRMSFPESLSVMQYAVYVSCQICRHCLIMLINVGPNYCHIIANQCQLIAFGHKTKKTLRR